MKRIQGLENLCREMGSPLSVTLLAELLIKDLRHCHCSIYGVDNEDRPILLADLRLVPESLIYEPFDKRIDLHVEGQILKELPPLTYALEGECIAITGRCSMIGKVCGVDLYLHKSYTGLNDDKARQRFSIPIAALLKRANNL